MFNSPKRVNRGAVRLMALAQVADRLPSVDLGGHDAAVLRGGLYFSDQV